MIARTGPGPREPAAVELYRRAVSNGRKNVLNVNVNVNVDGIQEIDNVQVHVHVHV
jgi:hypothetical protein